MICGIDEAGRGCLAGSLFISGVVGSEEAIKFLLDSGIKDSKKLSKEKRFNLAKLIQEKTNFVIVKFSAKEIDSFGLSACLKKGIELIIDSFSEDFLFKQTLLLDSSFGEIVESNIESKFKDIKFLMDGNTTFKIKANIESIIKGDDKVAQISAASILSKAHKDYEMQYLDSIYPQYGFKNNSGYGVKAHKLAIKEHGLSLVHRSSFRF